MISELSKNDILFGFSIVVLVIFLSLIILIVFHILRELSSKYTSRKFNLNISGNPLVGIAGQDLKFGDCVIIGEDGKIYRAKS